MENSTTAGAISYVTRHDILNFPFPYKLWLIVNLEFCEFLRWNRDGTVILLDLIALEDYLNTTRSIFKIKNRSVFLQHLEEFKFERLNSTPEAEEDLLLQYKNENFQRHRLDLLAKIRRHTYQDLGEMEDKRNDKSKDGRDTNIANNEDSDVATVAQRQKLAEEQKYRQVADRMLGDLCFMSHGGLSNIQKSRLRFQTILSFQNESRILEAKLKASDERAALQAQQRRLFGGRSGSAGALGVEEEQVIELPVDLFENPHDSVLHLGDDFRPEYAGYYGNCSREQVLNFFGDYLPMYEDGTMEVKKIVAETSSANKQPPNLNSKDDQPCGQTELGETNFINMPTLQQTEQSHSQQNLTILNLSSSLEPIFKNEEEDEGDKQNQDNQETNNFGFNDAEADISMEEFIKFKVDGKDDKETVAPNHVDNTEDFPQMPAAVKMEITEKSDMENEANFRNFFSQYRASLNLLYEHH